MKKFLTTLCVWYIFFVSLCFVLIFPLKALAESDFATSGVAEYSVSESGRTRVTHTVTLKNKFSAIHAVSYTFAVVGVTPYGIRAFENGKDLPIEIQTQNLETKILITFPKAVVGRDKSRTFTIEYYDEKTAIRNGQVWEITIPKIADLPQYESYNTKLTVPTSFGQPAYLSPKPTSRSEALGTRSYFYTGAQITQAGVVASFGQFQIFNLTLLYHLKSPSKQNGQTEIALPPDTAFQRVYYESMNPAPASVRIDEDGNWLASYDLKTDEQIDIEARVVAQLFAQPQEFRPQTPIRVNENLKPSEFWQTEDPQIKALANDLKTPENIYNYLVANLRYDYSRVQQGIKRLGAQVALTNPTDAICMEFTDLFVALARAAGIPAREVNGFAYTDNPELQPLSLVADVLHSWPEYWDEQRKIWVPIDPTWGNTTGGVDYFSKFDLSHITFAIHGKSSTDPLPAGFYKTADNPQKDVVVYFGNLPEERTPSLSLIPALDPKPIPFIPYKGKIIVKNDGPVALYNVLVKTEEADGVLKLSQTTIATLLPYSTVEIPFTWKTEPFSEAPKFTIVAENSSVTYTVPHEFIFWQILGIFSTLIALGAILLSPLLIRRKIDSSRKKNNGQEKSTKRSSKFSRRLPF